MAYLINIGLGHLAEHSPRKAFLSWEERNPWERKNTGERKVEGSIGPFSLKRKGPWVQKKQVASCICKDGPGQPSRGLFIFFHDINVMEIKQVVQYFALDLHKGLPYFGDPKVLAQYPAVPFSQVVYEMDETLRKAKPEAAETLCVADFSARHSSHSVRRNIREQPCMGLVMSYSMPVDIPQVYKDFRDVDAREKARSLGYHYFSHPDFHEFNGEAVFSYKHWLTFPVNLTFGENRDGIATQQNELSVNMTAEPDKDIIRRIRELCNGHGECLIFEPSYYKASDRFCRSTQFGSLSSYVPDFEVVVKWHGPDFDRKAIDLYGELRLALHNAHRRAVLKHAGRIFDANAAGKKEVVLNQEFPGQTFSDMRCHMFCVVPFEYHGEKKAGSLAYSNFYGR